VIHMAVGNEYLHLDGRMRRPKSADERRQQVFGDAGRGR
jgi:hypothetical protein